MVISNCDCIFDNGCLIKIISLYCISTLLKTLFDKWVIFEFKLFKIGYNLLNKERFISSESHIFSCMTEFSVLFLGISFSYSLLVISWTELSSSSTLSINTNEDFDIGVDDLSKKNISFCFWESDEVVFTSVDLLSISS